MIRKFIKETEGSMLPIAAAATFLIIGFSAVAIDSGILYTARSQLQAAADASALGGATGMLIDQGVSVSRAISIAGANTCINENIVLDAGNISFPTSDRISVQVEHDVPLFFARIFGMQNLLLRASATAQYGTLTGVGGLKPWAIPDGNYYPGQHVTLKLGNPNSGVEHGFFYCVRLPGSTGADAYRDAIINGTDEIVRIGDILDDEPGNMVGPTRQGVNHLMDLDPQATWDNSSNTVEGSAYPGYSSPRILKVILFDNKPSLHTVEVTGFGAFFLTGMQGQDVTGYFMETVSAGEFGQGNSMLMGVRLVE